MINTDRFNKSILDIIKLHSYEFYTVERDLNVACTCVTSATEQADLNCMKCLGTGYKIRIRKVKGASQDTKLPPTFRSDKVLVARNYFLPTNNIELKEDDIIVDRDSVYLVFEYQQLLGLEGSIPYKKYSATKKKFDSGTFFKNFNNIIRRR